MNGDALEMFIILCLSMVRDHREKKKKWGKMENGSISIAFQMRHILALLDSVASTADGIKKEA